MQISKDISLLPYNTFGVDVAASQLFCFSNTHELIELLRSYRNRDTRIFVLGGGSNVLFTDNFDGLIIHPANKGIAILDQSDVCATIEVQAGEDWDDFVAWAVAHELYGTENLSLIPGSVGAAPVQNIGAYGSEVCQLIKLVKAVEIDTGNEVSFLNYECRFGYRDSVFKNSLKDKYVITSVLFSLTKYKNLNLNYADLQQYFAQRPEPGIQDVRDAVCEIRNAKLPDYKVFGNAGSFFKNPVVAVSELQALQSEFRDIRYFPINESFVKLAAGWLIDACGLKGYRKGRAGVHQQQALVLVNYGGATGSEIVALAGEIQHRVCEKFGVNLEYEVNRLP